MGLAGQQLGLGQFQAGLAGQAPSVAGQQISALTGLGAQQQAREQAEFRSTKTTCVSTSLSTIPSYSGVRYKVLWD